MRIYKGKAEAFLFIIFWFIVFCGCNSEKNEQPLFEVLDHTVTGLDFTNKLTPTNQFNVFHYMYYYNGAGVAAGDFNNDGLIDLFFAASQGDHKIYLYAGKIHFMDIT